VSLEVTVSTSEPFTARVPIQSPEAVQLVALVEFQVTVEVPLEGTDVGDAVSVRVGGVTAGFIVVNVIYDVALTHPGKLS
jgi:hypothetical protein